jgi:adenylate cyclase
LPIRAGSGLPAIIVRIVAVIAASGYRRVAMASEVQRKLTTILAADAAGYSREMAADEVRALSALKAARGVFAKLIERRRGRIANTAGDALIAEFPSAVEAVQCAIEVQRELGGAGPAPEGGLRFRIGVHLGDVLVDGDDLLGEGVNLAARLQSMAEPGSVLISQQVYDQVQKKLSVGFEYLGEKRPKNFADDVAVYRVSSSQDASRVEAGGAREAREPRAPAQTKATADDRRQRTIRRAAMLGAIWAVLLAVDLGTGPPFWAHWPGMAMATWLALDAAPLFAQGRSPLVVRALVIVVALALVNLFTWSGYAWFLWPAGALLLFVLMRRLFARPG